MAHYITNRKRSYKSGSESFIWEALNASTYIVGALCFVVGSVFSCPRWRSMPQQAPGCS